MIVATLHQQIKIDSDARFILDKQAAWYNFALIPKKRQDLYQSSSYYTDLKQLIKIKYLNEIM